MSETSGGASTTNRGCALGWTCMLIFGAVLLILVSVLVLLSRSGHRRVPDPPGLVCQLSVREVLSPLDSFGVYPMPGATPCFAVFSPESNGPQPFEATWTVHGYPGGEGREFHRCENAVAANREMLEKLELAPPVLDLDGDGRADCLETGAWNGDLGLVRISTERDGRVLLEDRDDLEYEFDRRAFPLGDLDGDGKGELALIHPRMDRSAYDPESWDAVLGAKSWISIVSGSRTGR